MMTTDPQVLDGTITIRPYITRTQAETWLAAFPDA